MRSYALPSSRAESYQGFFQEMQRLLGEAATAKLVEKYGGGSRVYIPLKVEHNHPLAELLGLEAAQFLGDEYGGLSIEIPRNVALQREQRNRLIFADWQAGMNKAEIALKHKLTTRYIRKILNNPLVRRGEHG